jgi:TPR repeat protein
MVAPRWAVDDFVPRARRGCATVAPPGRAVVPGTDFEAFDPSRPVRRVQGATGVNRATKWWVLMGLGLAAAVVVIVTATEIGDPEWTLYPTCEGLEACRAACDAGDGHGCNAAGIGLDEGEGVPRDRAAALALFERGCELGAAPACTNVAYRESDEGRAEWWKRRAFDLEVEGCERRVIDDCRAVAYAYAGGEVVDKNELRATAMADELIAAFDRMCPERGWWPCVAAARLADGLAGESSPAQLERALPYFEKACAAGRADSCWAVGDTLNDLGKDGRARIERACEMSEDGGHCWNPADDDDRDLLQKRVAKLARRCAAKWREDCLDLVEADDKHPQLRSGEARRASRAAADALLQDECDRGMGDSCWRLALMLGGKQALGRDGLRAADLCERSCALGFTSACFDANNDRPVRGVAAYFPGAFHDCARTQTGDIRCWGVDGSGQLGVPARKDEYAPVTLPMRNVRHLALGNSSTCSLLESGAVECWGGNSFGELGNGRGPDRHEPRAVPGLADVAVLRGGDYGFCALDATGRAWCWGSTGAGSSVEPEELGQRGVKDVYFLDGAACVRTADAVLCRREYDDRWVRAPGLPPEDGLVVTADGACVLGPARTVRCFAEEQGWLAEPKLAFVEIADTAGTVELSLADVHACARKEDGTVACWTLGQDRARTIDGVTDAVQVVDDCAVVKDGTLFCWKPGGWPERSYGVAVVATEGP